MAMFLDVFMSKYIPMLTDFVKKEEIMVLGVKDEIEELVQWMTIIQSLLEDVEKRKFDEPSIEIWLSELKDEMHDFEDIIDLCRSKAAQLLIDQNSSSKTSTVCCSFSSALSCFTSVPVRHEIGNKIKKFNDRLIKIFEIGKQFRLENTISGNPNITEVNLRETSSMLDPSIVGREVEDATSRLVDLLIEEKADEKCRIFAVTGMRGVGKTALAQKIINHPKIKAFFNLDPVWVCVTYTYSEIELLEQVIRGVKGSYRDAKSKSDLQSILSGLVASGQSFFLVLDDVWSVDVWFDLLRVPLCNSNVNVRVLVTTRHENVATEMGAACIHSVELLSEESCWEVLRERLFSKEQVELANKLKGLGFEIIRKFGRLPLAIKAISSVLATRERSREEWQKVLRNEALFISLLPPDVRGALYKF